MWPENSRWPRHGTGARVYRCVIDFELYRDFTFVNQLARKYTGAGYTRGYFGEERYKVTIRVDSWTGQ